MASSSTDVKSTLRPLRRLDREAAAAAATGQAAVPARVLQQAANGGYIFTFGQFKGISHVVRRDHPKYVDWLLANPLCLAHRPDLCRALRSAGRDVDTALKRLPPQTEPRTAQELYI